MSGQASNMTFSDSAIQRAVIERVFDERKKYLIIALTGKIGAGSSYVSSFIQKASNGEEIPCSSSECNNYSSDEIEVQTAISAYPVVCLRCGIGAGGRYVCGTIRPGRYGSLPVCSGKTYVLG